MTDNLAVDFSVLDTLPISSWKYPRILVGIPLERTISHADQVFFNFLEIATQGPAFIDQKYGRIDVTRNMMVKALLESNYTHLLMLDLDHIHPTNIIQRLARWIIVDPSIQIVSGLNFRRGAPFDPVMGSESSSSKDRKLVASWPQGLLRSREVGGASLLVSRKVFETIEPPWFYNIYTEVWQNSWPGEDIGFSRKCSAANIEMFVDTTTTSPHCTDALITEETYRAYLAANTPREPLHGYV